MRHLPLAITAVLLTSGAWAGGNVKINKTPLKVGDTGTVSETLKMNIDLNITMGTNGNMNGTMIAQRDVTREFEVLEMGPAGPARVKVTYVVATNHEEMFGQAKDEAMPVQGNTYVMTLDSEGDVSSVVVDGGAEVPGPAQTYLMGDGFISTGGLHFSDDETESLPIGTSLDDMANIGGAMPKFDADKGEISATLSGSRKDDGHKVGIIDMVIKGTFHEGSMAFGFDGSGEMLIHQKAGHIHGMNLSAPITLSGKETTPDGMNMEMSGKGTMEMLLATRRN